MLKASPSFRGSHNSFRVFGYYLLVITLPLIFFPWGRIYLPSGNQIFFSLAISTFLIYFLILSLILKMKIVTDVALKPLTLIIIGYFFGVFVAGMELKSIELYLKIIILIGLCYTIAYLAPSSRSVRNTILYLILFVAVLVILELIQILEGHIRIVNILRELRTRQATAYVLLILIPFPLVNAVMAPRRLFRLLYFLLCFLLIIGLFFTYSRGGILSLFLGFITSIFLVNKDRQWRKLRKHFLLIALGIMVVSLIVLFISPYSLQSRLVSSIDFGGEIYDTSNPVRIALFKVGIRIIVFNPVLGIGPGRFNDVFREYTSSKESILLISNYFSDSHCQFIDVWHDGGLLAFIGLVWLLISLLRRLRCCLTFKMDLHIKYLLIGSLILWINSFWFFFIETPMDLEMFWIFLGLTLAILRFSRINMVQTCKVRD